MSVLIGAPPAESDWRRKVAVIAGRERLGRLYDRQVAPPGADVLDEFRHLLDADAYRAELPVNE